MKDMVKGMKRQTTEWEKIFANYIYDENLYLYCAYDFPELWIASNKKKKLNKKMRKRFEHFTKENIWMADKQMKNKTMRY